jgi:hypothetical protein
MELERQRRRNVSLQILSVSVWVASCNPHGVSLIYFAAVGPVNRICEENAHYCVTE